MSAPRAPRAKRPAAIGALISSVSPGFLWIAAVFLITLAIYAAFSYRVMVYTEPPTGDQPYYLMTAISIIHDHDIEESNNYKAQNERLYYPLSYDAPFQGILAPFPLPPHNGHTTARPPNESYSKHGLGLSVMIVPGWLWGENLPVPLVDLKQLQLISAGWPAVVYELNILGALLAVQVFLLAWEISGSKLIALAVAAALVFSNPQMSYSYLIFPELPAGLLTIYALRRLLMGLRANNWFQLLLTGVCIGYTPWLHSRYLPITFALMALAFVQWLRASRPLPRLFGWRPLPATGFATTAFASPTATTFMSQPASGLGNLAASAGAWLTPLQRAVPAGPAGGLAALLRRPYRGSMLLVLLPALFGGLLLMAFYQWLYGLPLPNTQDHAGFINPLTDPLGLPASILGLLLDEQWGLLVYAPVYVLAFVGFVAMARNPERRRLLFWLLWVIVPYYLFVAEYLQWWGEWCPPARYLASITPLLALPLAESLRVLRDRVAYKALFFILAAVGWVMMAGLLADPRAMWNDPTGQAKLFQWLQQQFDMNLVPLFPGVVHWAFWHGYGMNWILLVAWAFICLAIVLFGVLVLPRRRVVGDRVSGVGGRE